MSFWISTGRFDKSDGKIIDSIMTTTDAIKDTDKTLALFQSQELALSGFSDKEIAFLKEHEWSFDFDNAKPIYTTRNTYSVRVGFSGGQIRTSLYESIYGAICDHRDDGAVKVHIGKWKRGLLSMTTSKSGHPLCELLFVFRRYPKALPTIVMMWVRPDGLKRLFVETPEKLAKQFRFSRMNYYEQDDGRSQWRSSYHNVDKRIPVLELLKEGYEFNLKCYPATLFPKTDNVEAVKYWESGERYPRTIYYHLVSNGKGMLMFYKSDGYMRRSGGIKVKIKGSDGFVGEEMDLVWRRVSKTNKESITFGSLPFDPIFESYLLHN